MLIQGTSEPVSKVNVESPVVDFHVDAENTQHIVYMMVNMYKDPLMAVVRELIANAADEHARLGLTKKFKVIAPTSVNPTFVVRDFAEGLSEEEVYRLITGIGSSGGYKRKDVNTTGGFGIGAKSPATITDQWMITSHHAGVMKVYSAFKGETGNLQLTKMGEAPTTESGLEVSVPIKASFINPTATKIAKVISAYSKDELPEIIGVDFRTLATPQVAVSVDGVDIYTNSYHGPREALINLNRVLYPIDRGQFDLSDKILQFWVQAGICIKITDQAEKAVINVTPSRESLIYTTQLKDLIINKIYKLNSEFFKEIQNQINKESNFIDAQNLRTKFASHFYRFVSEAPCGFTFQGKPFVFGISIDFTEVLNTNSEFWVNKTPELRKLFNLTDETLPFYNDYRFGKIIRTRPAICCGLLAAKTQIPIATNYDWYINDLPETWRTTPRKILDFIREKANDAKKQFVLINDIPGFVDHIDTFFPNLSKSFKGKLSDVKALIPKKEIVRKSKVNTDNLVEDKSEQSKIDSEYIELPNAKFAFIGGKNKGRGLPTKTARSLKGKTLYVIVDNLSFTQRAYELEEGISERPSLIPAAKYVACVDFVNTLHLAAGININLIAVLKSYYDSAGVPKNWEQLTKYVVKDLFLNVKVSNRKVYDALLDLSRLTFLEQSKCAIENSELFSATNNKNIIDLVRSLNKYKSSNDCKFKSSKVSKLCKLVEHHCRAISYAPSLERYCVSFMTVYREIFSMFPKEDWNNKTNQIDLIKESINEAYKDDYCFRWITLAYVSRKSAESHYNRVFDKALDELISDMKTVMTIKKQNQQNHE